MNELSTEDEHQAAALEFDVFAKHCPSRQVLDHPTGRWGVLIMAGLRKEPARFNVLRRRIDGISEKCSRRRSRLWSDGFVSREVFSLFKIRPGKVREHLRLPVAYLRRIIMRNTNDPLGSTCSAQMLTPQVNLNLCEA